MKATIMLTNITKGKEYTCVNYLLLSNDYLIDNEHAKGFTYLTSFSKNESILEQIDLKKDLLIPVECTFRKTQDYKNPLNTRLMLETITLTNGKNINLL